MPTTPTCTASSVGRWGGNFSPVFKLSLAHKDLRLALKMASELGVPTPLGDVAFQYHSLAMADGLGDEGQAAYIKVIEKVAGVQARVKTE